MSALPGTLDETVLRYDAVAIGRAASQVAGSRAPEITVTTSRSDVAVNVTGADFALTADTAVAFPAPATLTISLSAPGFAGQTEAVTIDPAALPLSLGTFGLRPNPVRLQGRVVVAAGGAPLAGARVLSIDDPTVGTPPAVHTLTLGRPLQRPHAAGVTVEELAVTATGPALTLARPAALGDTALTLADRSGLAGGDLLGLSPTPAGDYLQYAQIADPGPAPLSAAGTVTLDDPLTMSLPAGAGAASLTTATTGSVALSEACVPGDAVIVAAGVAAGLVCVEPGTRQEYRSVGAVSDDDGYWRLDGVGHVASLWLGAEAAGYQIGHQKVTVPYGVPVTVVDFKLAP